MKLFLLIFGFFLAAISTNEVCGQQFYFITGNHTIGNHSGGGVYFIVPNVNQIQLMDESELDEMFEVSAPGPMNCYQWKGQIGGSHNVVCGPAYSFVQDQSGAVEIICGDFSPSLCVISERVP